MPPPYSIIPIPAGDWDDLFDFQAIEMSISHNSFIRGLNAIYAQAQKIEEHQVKGFTFFCDAFIDLIHHHHTIEEELLFPFYETKMGANYMSHNVEQHHAFLDGLTDLHTYIKDVYAGNKKYNGDLVIEKLNTFSDTLVEHLRDEIPTLESSKIRKAFTLEDLQALTVRFKKRALEGISLPTIMPLVMILHDKSTAPRFPPLPKPILWAAQYGLYYLHSDAWVFGPCDVHGRLKPGFGNDFALKK